jgi:hypothetical protein
MRRIPLLLALLAGCLFAQTAGQAPGNPLDALKFLEGTWEAKTPGGSTGPTAAGTYVFRKELDGHILARHSSSDSCKGPADFDCDHHDLLYVYPEGGSLKAIYFDGEGHVIHYEVSTPAPTTAVFLSSASQPGPQFRLTYERKEAGMWGKFQMQMPGQTEWKSYLEWSGPKK